VKAVRRHSGSARLALPECLEETAQPALRALERVLPCPNRLRCTSCVHWHTRRSALCACGRVEATPSVTSARVFGGERATGPARPRACVTLCKSTATQRLRTLAHSPQRRLRLWPGWGAANVKAVRRHSVVALPECLEETVQLALRSLERVLPCAKRLLGACCVHLHTRHSAHCACDLVGDREREGGEATLFVSSARAFGGERAAGPARPRACVTLCEWSARHLQHRWACTKRRPLQARPGWRSHQATPAVAATLMCQDFFASRCRCHGARHARA